jgi:hypothetical protein
MKVWPALFLVSTVACALATASLGAAPATPSGIRILKSDRSDASPCEDVDLHGRFVRGGCSGKGNAFAVRMSIRTAFGPMRFGDCALYFQMTLAASGRLWLDDLHVAGSAPCSDSRPCASRTALAARKASFGPAPPDKVRPWTGQVVGRAGDGYPVRFYMCIDTCIGRYAGDVEMTLARQGHGWRLRARSAGVGDGGLELDGDIDISGLRAHIRTSASAR